MQVHELRDRVHDVAGVLQRAEPLLRHACAHDLVVVEAHTTPGVRARLRLADVVEQRGQPHEELGARVADHRDGVGEHVLVAVHGILLEAHGVELGQELVGEPGRREEPQARARIVDQQELGQLVTDALRADDLEAMTQLLHCRHEIGLRLEGELRQEARRPQHAKRIVEERHRRLHRRAQSVRRKVCRATERIDQLRIGQPEGHRVDREVAP